VRGFDENLVHQSQVKLEHYEHSEQIGMTIDNMYQALVQHSSLPTYMLGTLLISNCYLACKCSCKVVSDFFSKLEGDKFEHMDPDPATFLNANPCGSGSAILGKGNNIL
jgi:hypothetical protein